MSAPVIARLLGWAAALAATALALSGCGGSPGGLVSWRDGHEAQQARALVTRAGTLVAANPEALGYRLRVAAPRRGIRGQTDRVSRTVTLFVSGTDAPHRVAHDLAHEIGHAYDAVRMSAAARAAYLLRRGVPAAQWSPGGRVSDYDSGAGDFAEVFALCHAASPEFRSTLAPRPVDPCPLLPAGARSAAAIRSSRSST
jgi:hypothetical protein